VHKLIIWLALLLLVPTARAQTQDEPPLQDEKMFQQLLTDYHLLARLLIHQKRLPEAVPIVRKIYELSFRPPKLAIELCDLLDQSGATGETIPILQEQMKVDPLNTYWPKRLITASEKAERWSEALQLRTTWRKNHPSDVENIAGLAEVYRKLGREKEADDLTDKLAMTARDKLFRFTQPPPGYLDPKQDQFDAEGLAALQLERKFGFEDDFEQYAAAYLLRQRRRENLDLVLGWLREKPPAGYLKSVFPEQQAVGLWLAGKRNDAAALIEKKFPPRKYPGADHLLVRHYTELKQPERIQVRFGEDVPEYLGLKSNKPKAEAPKPAVTQTNAPPVAPAEAAQEAPIEDLETGGESQAP
jgi:hypothetical protein